MEFIATGDSLFSSRNLSHKIDSQIVELLKNSDAAFTNAEFSTPAINTAPAAGRGYVTAVRPNRIDELKKLNFNLINFANNHTGDFGVEGVLDTIQSAENRDVSPIGIGRSLDEAKKPRFADTNKGRIGVVSASSTRASAFLASDAGNGVPARPGLNPLRWEQKYVLSTEEFNQLKKINKNLGTEKSAEIGTKIERWKSLENNQFYFGSMYEEKLLIEEGKSTEVKTFVNTHDLKVICEQISDASKRSDYTVFNIHSHEGQNEDWYNDTPADFIQEAAHAIIDAGADIFIGHGAHFLRGIELYHGKPIFYNLGSFLMEFEAGESIIPPEMYESYGFSPKSPPSDLHQSRAYENGKFAGFNGNRVFSEGAIVKVNISNNGKTTYHLIPTNLRMDDEKSLNRGIPVIASGKRKIEIIDRLKTLSTDLHTELEFDPKTNELRLFNK